MLAFNSIEIIYCSVPSESWSKFGLSCSLLLVSVTVLELCWQPKFSHSVNWSLNLEVLRLTKSKVKGRFPGGWNISSRQSPHQQTKTKKKTWASLGAIPREGSKDCSLSRSLCAHCITKPRSFRQLHCLPYKASSSPQSTSESQWGVHEFMCGKGFQQKTPPQVRSLWC